MIIMNILLVKLSKYFFLIDDMNLYEISLSYELIMFLINFSKSKFN